MRANLERAKYWQQHIEAHKASGLTLRAYCEQSNIRLSSLDYWRNRRRRSERDSSEVARSGWIPLRISEDNSSPIDLHIGRMTIEIKPGFNQALLVELLRTIGALC